MTRHLLSALAIAVTTISALASAAPHFSFHAVEFDPAEQRLPEAQAFLARAAAPGTPMPVAIRAIEHADAACHGDSGPVTCRYSRPVQHSDWGSGVLDDVVWTVQLVPGPGARIAAVTVDRTLHGD